MKAVRIFAAAVFIVVPVRADESLLKRPVEAFESNGEPALIAILRFGRENHIPFGVVVSAPLCQAKITGLKIEKSSAEVALRKLSEKLPSYGWDVEESVVVVAPTDIAKPVARFLAVVPPEYKIAEDTAQAQLAWAWMNIRAALRPQEGTAFDILTATESVKWPALTVRDITVRQLLNRLVARDKGGAWLIYPFPDFEKVADRRPIQVLDYTEELPVKWEMTLCANQ